MATTLYLRHTNTSGISLGRDLLTTAGADANVESPSLSTTSGGTEIQFTLGGIAHTFYSGRVPAGGFTLSGTVSFNFLGMEANMSANAKFRVRLYKYSGGSLTALNALDDDAELPTAGADCTWTGTATSTAFAENDRLAIRVYVTNSGTMGGGYGCFLYYGGVSGGSYDSSMQISQTVAFKSESGDPFVMGTGSFALSGTDSFVGRTTFFPMAAGSYSLSGGSLGFLPIAVTKFHETGFFTKTGGALIFKRPLYLLDTGRFLPYNPPTTVTYASASLPNDGYLFLSGDGAIGVLLDTSAATQEPVQIYSLNHTSNTATLLDTVEDTYTYSLFPGTTNYGFAFVAAVSYTGDHVVLAYPNAYDSANMQYDSESQLIRPGAVLILSRSGSTWTAQKVIVGTPLGTGANSGFGEFASINGDGSRLVVSPSYARQGLIYTYTRSSSTWTTRATIATKGHIQQNETGDYALIVNPDYLVTSSGRPYSYGAVTPLVWNSGTNTWDVISPGYISYADDFQSVSAAYMREAGDLFVTFGDRYIRWYTKISGAFVLDSVSENPAFRYAQTISGSTTAIPTFPSIQWAAFDFVTGETVARMAGGYIQASGYGSYPDVGLPPGDYTLGYNGAGDFGPLLGVTPDPTWTAYGGAYPKSDDNGGWLKLSDGRRILGAPVADPVSDTFTATIYNPSAAHFSTRTLRTIVVAEPLATGSFALNGGTLGFINRFKLTADRGDFALAGHDLTFTYIPASGIAAGAGSSVAQATVSGIGAAISVSSASAVASSSAEAVGTAIAEAVGSSVAGSAAAGFSNAPGHWPTVGSAAVSSSASAVGAVVIAAVGEAVVTSEATAFVGYGKDAVGASAAVSSAAAAGEITYPPAGVVAGWSNVTGTSTANGAGASILMAYGECDAVAAAPGFAVQPAKAASGVSRAIASVFGAGVSIVRATGTSAASSASLAVGAIVDNRYRATQGTCSGASSSAGVGCQIAQSVGTSVGSSTAQAIAGRIMLRAGTGQARSMARGIGAAIHPAVGHGMGMAAASGVGAMVDNRFVSGTGAAVAGSLGVGYGAAIKSSVGECVAVSVGRADGVCISPAQGICLGYSRAMGISPYDYQKTVFVLHESATIFCHDNSKQITVATA